MNVLPKRHIVDNFEWASKISFINKLSNNKVFIQNDILANISYLFSISNENAISTRKESISQQFFLKKSKYYLI